MYLCFVYFVFFFFFLFGVAAGGQALIGYVQASLFKAAFLFVFFLLLLSYSMLIQMTFNQAEAN